jgi:hypothetical protein
MNARVTLLLVFTGQRRFRHLLGLNNVITHRNVVYFTYGDKRVTRLSEVVEALQRRRVSVGQLYQMLSMYEAAVTRVDFFAFVLNKLGA